MLGPITMKLGTLMSNGKSSPKQNLQVCKQLQTASGNINLFMPITNLGYFEMYVNCSMGVKPQIHFLFISYNACECVKKGKGHHRHPNRTAELGYT